MVLIPKEKISYIYSSFHQLNSLTTAAVLDPARNDATRVLMAANMLRQAIPPFINQRPLVASGIEESVFLNSPLTIKAQEKGQVEYVDSEQIIIKESGKEKRTYELKQLVVSNKNTLSFSSPLVKKGEKIEKGQIIAGSSYSSNNEACLGYNLRVAYLC